MAWFERSERGIGRGEVAESQIEAPFFALFMMVCAVGLFLFQIYVQNPSYTVALAVSMFVFGITIIKVEYGIYVLVIAMLLSPEIATGNVGANDERDVNLRYDDVLIIIIFLGVMVKLAFEGQGHLWRPNPINYGIFAYYSICVVSTMEALRLSVPAWDKSVAFFVMLKMLEFYLIFFMVGLAVTNMKEVRRQLTVFFVVSIIVCTYAIASIGTLDRVSAPFESGGTEPNTLGGYLMIIMCIAGGLFVYAPSFRKKLLFTAISVAALIPLIMTLSRASYLALIVAFVTIALAGRKFTIVLTVAAVLAASPFIMPKDVKDRINYTFLPSGEAVQVAGYETSFKLDKSTHERIYVWQKVRYNLTIWPWLGGGVSWDTVLDSQYARVIIETGIFGIIAFSALLLLILRTTRQAYVWSQYWMAKGLALGIFATTIGLMVHSLGTISFLIVRIMEPFWFLLALTVVVREIALRDYYHQLEAYRKAQHEQENALLPAELNPSEGLT